ncbi:MAG: portal protein, partial [Hyphomicrobium sp.]
RTAKALSGWLAPSAQDAAIGGRLPAGESPSANKNARLELRPDIDQVAALSSERDALWTRLQAVSFLTDDEKRAAVGYGVKT